MTKQLVKTTEKLSLIRRNKLVLQYDYPKSALTKLNNKPQKDQIDCK